MSPLPVISRAELEKHNAEGSGYIVINDLVYDLSKFYALHPGGEEVLREHYGKVSGPSMARPSSSSLPCSCSDRVVVTAA